MSVADILQQAGYCPQCPQPSPNAGDAQTRSPRGVPIVPSVPNENTKVGTDSEMLDARCREACRGLPVSPAGLLAEMSEADKQAQRDSSEGVDVLRAAAECMAESAEPALDGKIEKAYKWCRAELAKHPEYHRTLCTFDPDADPVLMAVAVRGIGCATLRIERQNFAGREFELLELIHRTDMPEVES